MDPRTLRGRATRLRIVDTAARLMHVGGVAATSVDDVLTASGTGRGQFYHYFTSKDELVRAVLEYQAEKGERELAEAFAKDRGWAGVRAWLDSIADEQRRVGYVGGCPIGSIAAEAADRDPSLRDILQATFERKRAKLAERLRELRERGELVASADPDALAMFVVASIQGGLLLASTFRQGRAVEDAIDGAWAHIRSLAPADVGETPARDTRGP